MSLDILDILFKLDYFVCLLIGFPLNIILIILIIFKTPKEMKTHSRILIQNSVLDILMLINQMFVQSYYLLDTEWNIINIFPNGILLSFMDFYPIICNIIFVFWLYIGNLNLHGLCVQFIYRYLVLNRKMKINFRRYLFLLSITLILQLFYILYISLIVTPYSFGGVKYFDQFNKTLPFIQYKTRNMTFLQSLPLVLREIFPYLPMILLEILPYFIIIICGFKMVRYVNLNTNLDGNLKRLNKLLTKVLIILVSFLRENFV
uniref:G-protein coupled receptors family 1 profile domain-containing protein n=1 Tax=Meloidogyne enterolobii TaxID=390850 RepID=A0A6V7WJ51_MELEN|nr:unnamed protein product [Meloidogyne enterolobii]